MQKILFVSHCILNTTAEMVRYGDTGRREVESRLEFVVKTVEQGIQLAQLPCPEFTLYGSGRWGHTKRQSDNPFFREHCRKILEPILTRMKAYMAPGEQGRFLVLGMVGIDGNPSRGVSRTRSGCWGGEFSGKTDLREVLSTCYSAPGIGVMMEVLKSMMKEEGIQLPVEGLKPGDLQAVMSLVAGTQDTEGDSW